jgi:hypothetical protein
MTEKDESYFWERNIKPVNDRLWFTLLRWRFKMYSYPIRKVKKPDDFGLNFDINLLYKLALILIGLTILSTFVILIKDVVYLVYPNYGNNSMIIRDFIKEIGAN